MPSAALCAADPATADPLPADRREVHCIIVEPLVPAQGDRPCVASSSSRCHCSGSLLPRL
jgi:hypothetical protein